MRPLPAASIPCERLGEPATIHRAGPDADRSPGIHDAGMYEPRPDLLDGRIRVILAVPHRRTRTAIRAVLEANGEIVVAGEARAALHVPRIARAAAAHLVLVDLVLVLGGTLPTLGDLVRLVAPARVVTVGLLDDRAFRRASLGAGAAAHLVTDAAPDDYRLAVLAAVGGAR
jgi:DNA-binding NarL/FixJ family response regulator